MAFENTWVTEDTRPLAVFDTQAGAWVEELPAGLEPWTIEGLDEHHAWLVGEGARIPVPNSEEFAGGDFAGEPAVSACGRFVWISDRVYSVAASEFGTLYSISHAWFADASRPSEQGVIRGGEYASLDPDDFDDAWEDAAIIEEAPDPDERVFARRADGFVALQGAVLAEEDGPRLLLEMPHQTAAFSPSGESLALIDGAALHILDTHTFSMKTFKIS